MKLILHELNAAIESIKQDKLQPAFKMLARVSKSNHKSFNLGIFLRH